MINQKAPDFTLPDQDENQISLADFQNHWIVLYFYPKDNTSGCTLEAKDFTASLNEFNDAGAVVIGISPDSPKSHRNFISKQELNLKLLSDPEHEVLADYGVWQKKKMYGREYMGVVRSTFIIDPNGVIVAEWNKVKVKGHVEEVLTRLKEIKSAE